MFLRATTWVMLLAIIAVPQLAHAHFAWLATDDEGHAVFFFGESIAEKTYHLPEKMAKTAVHHWADGKSQGVAMTSVDSDSFIGRRSDSKVQGAGVLSSIQTYGIYRGSKLTYHSQHVAGPSEKWGQSPNKALPLQAVLTPRDDGGVVVHVFMNNKPVVDAKVQLFCDDGHEEGAAQTDDHGQVEFDGNQVEDGLNGLLVGHVDKTSSGEIDGAPYKGEANYLTVTFRR